MRQTHRDRKGGMKKIVRRRKNRREEGRREGPDMKKLPPLKEKATEEECPQSIHQRWSQKCSSRRHVDIQETQHTFSFLNVIQR